MTTTACAQASRNAAPAAFERLAARGLRWAVILDGAVTTRLGDAPRPEAHIRPGSVSKLLVGAVSRRLQSRGLLAGGTRLGALWDGTLPEDVAALTVADLEAHRSGLRDALECPAFRGRVSRDLKAPVPLDAVLQASLDQPRRPEGAGYRDVHAILLARLCEVAAGRPIEALVADVAGPGRLALRGPLPRPHPSGLRWGRAPDRIEYGDDLHDATGHDPSRAWAAGALAGRLRDLPARGPVVADLSDDASGRGWHHLARCRNGWVFHPGEAPGLSAWAGRERATGRVLLVSAGHSWTPGLGNPAEALAHAAAGLAP